MALIAIIADVHLPDEPDTLKDIYLDQALRRIEAVGPDVLLVAGDATARGGIAALKRFATKVGNLFCATLSTVGNSDLRTPENADFARQTLQCGGMQQLDDCSIVLLGKYDESQDQQNLAALKAAGKLPFIIASHFELHSFEPEIRHTVETLLTEGNGIFVAGHMHENASPDNADGYQSHLVRGIDPDKASGGPPCVTCFRLADGKWLREEQYLDWLLPEKWSAEIRNAFLDYLGFSTMSYPLDGLEFARQEKIQCIELRNGAAEAADHNKLKTALREWRVAVKDNYLSFHLGDVVFDDAGNGDFGKLEKSVALALEWAADHATVHLPGFYASLQYDRRFFERTIIDYTEVLRPLMDNSITIGFENMHLTGDNNDFERFGCTPGDALRWLIAFSSFSNCQNVGLLLDVGHARNNGRYGTEYNISQWFALTGHLITGYHLHQVKMLSGVMHNHSEFDSPYSKLIPLTSFFSAWHEKLIARKPVFLEIRSEQSPPASFEFLRNYLKETS